jgi:ATP-dependent Clp protease ATP-binding subunit ClpC
VKEILSLAGDEAKSLRHSYVGPEHILLGLMVEGDGIPARVLKTLFEVDEIEMRAAILRELAI